jgi:hypothetical protein
MGNPVWSAIPFEKLPEWKKQEILKNSKEMVEKIELNPLQCPHCGKVCKNKLGLNSHLKSHNK